jgi:ribonuclease HI
MNGPIPHYLLFCDGNLPTAENAASVGLSKSSGRWRFVLEQLESGEKLEASDRETGATPDRTALIAVLRGLEALEQPSRVTLVTTSRYVFRGLQYGLTEWRANDYCWEHFGTVQPIRNADIWKRIDRTLSFHKVQCRWISQSQPDESTTPDHDGELRVEPDAAKQLDHFTTEDHQTNEMVEKPVTSRRSKRKVDQHSTVYKDSGATVSRVFDAGRTSRTVTTNYVIAEVEKKDAPESELSTISTDENEALTPYSRIDSPIHTEHDSTEPTESRQEPIGPPPPKFLRRLSTVRSCVWQSLLRLDEEIEGYFRCLLLMEPRPPRRDP